MECRHSAFRCRCYIIQTYIDFCLRLHECASGRECVVSICSTTLWTTQTIIWAQIFVWILMRLPTCVSGAGGVWGQLTQSFTLQKSLFPNSNFKFNIKFMISWETLLLFPKFIGILLVFFDLIYWFIYFLGFSMFKFFPIAFLIDFWNLYIGF